MNQRADHGGAGLMISDPPRIEMAPMGVTLTNMPIRERVSGRQLVTRPGRMPASVGFETFPYFIDMFCITRIGRSIRRDIELHPERQHQPLQPAFGGDAVEVIGIGQPILLKQQFRIPPMAMVGVEKITLHQIPRAKKCSLPK